MSSRTSAADASASASSSSACFLAATWYSSMTKGVVGASALVSGCWAIQASYAGWNSSRKRST